MTDVGPPRLFTDERQTLVTFYGYLRERLLAKLDGLDDAAARHPESTRARACSAWPSTCSASSTSGSR